MKIIDSHIHCGIRGLGSPYENILAILWEADISGACVFPPVEAIYDRFDPWFQDTDQWKEKRSAANEYVLSLARNYDDVYPYFFVWNDFATESLEYGYRGIKWHRHDNEPAYHYDDPKCGAIIREITRRKLPVVYEESYTNTLEFVETMAPGARIIIPHLGALNGSYERLESAGVFDLPNIYADTALAAPQTILKYIGRYGTDRLFFGSDFPFGYPPNELQKIKDLGLSESDYRRIVSKNILRVLEEADSGRHD